MSKCGVKFLLSVEFGVGKSSKAFFEVLFPGLDNSPVFVSGLDHDVRHILKFFDGLVFPYCKVMTCSSEHVSVVEVKFVEYYRGLKGRWAGWIKFGCHPEFRMFKFIKAVKIAAFWREVDFVIFEE